MTFSIILPSFLGQYKNAASNREQKLIRAIDSVVNQSYPDWELIVVADGCEKTFDLVSERYADEDRISCFLIQKQTIFSGKVRGFGIIKAQGDYVVYLDSDDYFGADHLSKIKEGIENYDWVYFNDHLKTPAGQHHERECLIKQKYQNGTSNICHKRELKITWGNGYGQDDWSAVSSLLKYPNYAKIATPEYFCCHIPKRLDV